MQMYGLKYHLNTMRNNKVRYSRFQWNP